MIHKNETGLQGYSGGWVQNGDLFFYLWFWRIGRLQAVGGAGDRSGYGLGQGGEKGEEIEE
jgi:hypothetical protein